jgi:hypothetical protein
MEIEMTSINMTCAGCGRPLPGEKGKKQNTKSTINIAARVVCWLCEEAACVVSGEPIDVESQ